MDDSTDALTLQGPHHSASHSSGVLGAAGLPDLPRDFGSSQGRPAGPSPDPSIPRTTNRLPSAVTRRFAICESSRTPPAEAPGGRVVIRPPDACRNGIPYSSFTPSMPSRGGPAQESGPDSLMRWCEECCPNHLSSLCGSAQSAGVASASGRERPGTRRGACEVCRAPGSLPDLFLVAAPLMCARAQSSNADCGIMFLSLRR